MSSAYTQSETPYLNTQDDTLPAWARLMYEDPTRLDEIETAYHTYYSDHEFVKNGHTQYLKRLLRERETYAFQFNDPDLSATERQVLRQAESRYLDTYRQAQGSRDGNWTDLGPYDWDHDAAARSYAPGSAHVYTVEQCLNDNDIVYAGTATAGLWKSTNGGGFWTNITKDLAVNQVYAIETHPTDCSRLLAAMMNGIFLSTDEGATWTETGDFTFRSLNLATDDIKYARDGKVWITTNNGLFYSEDNGMNWTEKMNGAFQEIELHPTDNDIIYVIRQTGDVTEFYRSTNGGASFTLQNAGWPAPAGGDHNRRAEITVSADAPNKVYALLTGEVNGGSGLYGIYISEDAGSTWTFTCCGPQPGGPAGPENINMMGWSDVGTDDGGQFYYDLALAVDPNNADKVIVAGVNMWVSEDGGNSFTCPSKWSHPHKADYVHADIHDVNYYADGNLWAACDGGIFHSTDDGASFTRSSVGITGTDFWGFGVGFNDEDVMVGGAYHNGTLLKNGSVYLNDWLCTDGGDGVGGAVNPFYEDQVYSDYNIKTLSNDRTLAPSTRNYALEPSWTYVTGRFNQIEFASDNYNVHYFGQGTGLYQSEDDNRSVTQLYDFGEEVGDVEIGWNNSQIIYVATFPSYWGAKKLYRSSDGGVSWTDITPAATAASHVPYDVEVSYNDPDVIWAARIGRNTGNSNQVLKSTNGGATWIDISNAAINGEVLTNIIAQRGTNDHLYLGTTRTVYHSITDRALSRDEIREWRHLTKHHQATPGDPLFDADMLAYLQFNETASPIYDRVSTAHGQITSGTTLPVSSAPIGDGTSDRQLVNNGGTYTFTNEKLELVFPATGNHPRGEIVVTRLTNPAFVMPDEAVNTDHYWIVNNYGLATFTELTSAKFWGLPGINSAAAGVPQQFLLHKRASNADESPAWGPAIDAADSAEAGGTVTFSTSNGITSFSQLTIARDLTVLPVSFLDLTLKQQGGRQVLVSWATEQEIDADYFIVEHSRDGRTFEDIGRVPAANLIEGNTYNYLDGAAHPGLNYYRIRAVDFAESVDYSPLRSIDLGASENWANVFPNPLGENGNLRVTSDLPGDTYFDLFSANGRLVQRTKFSGSLYLRLPGLPAGSYTYRMTNGTATLTGKLVK